MSQKFGAVSKDFPLFHSQIIPIHVNLYEKPPSHLKIKNKSTYTNEHPELFRMDNMKESGYRNPYLDDVIKVDRNEFFKNKMDFNRRQIHLIDFIKSERKYSQDPNILRYIPNANNIDILHKREQNKIDKKNIKTDNTFSSEEKKYYNLIPNLNNHIPKVDYKMITTIDVSKPATFNKTRLNTENSNVNYLKEKFFCSPKNTSYLRNYNDYNIAEAQQRNINKEIYYSRKPAYEYDLIKGKVEKIKPPPLRSENWGTFYENYLTLLSDGRKFRRKGGLFSEFSDKNRNVIHIQKEEKRKELEELRESLKMKKNNITK